MNDQGKTSEQLIRELAELRRSNLELEEALERERDQGELALRRARGDKFVRYYFGADPIEDPDLFKDPRYMPFYNAGKVTTPTIMFTGDADVNVPTAMTWVTYRGIQMHGQAPVELYVFPGETHVLQRLSHKRRKLKEEQAWFDRYLFSN